MSTTELKPALVGRQPILDRELKVFGYELFFRHPCFDSPAALDGDQTTADVVVNTFLEIGLDDVVGMHAAFVNAARGFLINDFARELPPDRVVIEVVETVEPDLVVLAAIKRLREHGFKIALDDFVYRPELEPLLELADLVKVDITTLDAPSLVWHAALLKERKVRMVAERVETPEEFLRCRELGFDLFQGHFFERPSVLRGQRQLAGRMAALRLLTMLSEPATSVADLETAVSCDLALSYKLLRVINSAQFGLRVPVESLRQAIIYLGRERIHTWVALIALGGLNDKPDALAVTALIRAKMCERLASSVGPTHANGCFTVGLLSPLDAFLDTTMQAVADVLPVSDAIKAALVERSGPLGHLLSTVLAYERWDISHLSTCGIAPDVLRGVYLEAVRWAQRHGLEGGPAAAGTHPDRVGRLAG